MEAPWSVISIQDERDRDGIFYGGAGRGGRGYSRRRDDDASSTHGGRGERSRATSSTTVADGKRWIAARSTIL
eukprot:4742747-Pleurochrysis_carterae.AAC.1